MTHELEHFRQLLSDFGRAINLPNLRPDSEGYCCLSFDDTMRVHLQYNQRTANLVFFIELTKINEYDKEVVMRQLLQANVMFAGTNGNTLGFNPKTQMATLGYQEPIKNFDFSRFQNFLKSFMETAEEWTQRLVHVRDTALMPEGVFKADDYDPNSHHNLIMI